MKKILSILSALILLVSCVVDNVGNNELLFTPKVVDDYFSVQKNSELTITLEDVLKNDEVQQKTAFVSFDTTTSKGGTLTGNKKGSYIYVPKKDFVGTDTFEYTVCNDKSKNHCSSAKIVITVNDIDNNGNNSNISKFVIPNELKSYYSSLKFTKDATVLKENLKKIISKYDNKEYTARHKYLYKADADLNNPRKVISMYDGKIYNNNDYEGKGGNGKFNTEHVYPRSKLIDSRAESDLHHLRSCTISVNSIRKNKPFSEGKGKYKDWGATWYPGDEWKGDVARMIFYLNTMYNQPINDKIGSLKMFLKWNIEDPVSDFEKQRNREIQKAQGNRNPFIDNPYLATMIYGGKSAENTWK